MMNEEAVERITTKFQEELGGLVDDYAGMLQEAGTDFDGDDKEWGTGHILLLAIMRDWAEGNVMAIGDGNIKLAPFDPDDMDEEPEDD